MSNCNLKEMAEARLFKEMFHSIKDIKFKHYKLSYRRAHYEYQVNKDKEQAKKHIDEALVLLDKPSGDYGLIKCLIRYNLDELFIESILCVDKKNIYELAGQIYAQFAVNLDNYKTIALENYKKYHVLVQSYKEDKTTRNIDEISVYSFRPFSEYALNDLRNETITVARVSRMNDPFDSLANLWKKSDNLKVITKEKGHEDILDFSMDYYRIRSFVYPKEGESEATVLSNIRMWSSYANEHYGFCVKYKLHKGFTHNIDTNKWTVRRLAPVKYVSDFSMKKSMTAIDSYEAYNMKHVCWSYENEIRLLSYNTSTEDDFFSEPIGKDAEIEEIIFGYLCPKEQKKKIYNILKSSGVKFFQMTTTPEISIYHLIKEKYEPNND